MKPLLWTSALIASLAFAAFTLAPSPVPTAQAGGGETPAATTTAIVAGDESPTPNPSASPEDATPAPTVPATEPTAIATSGIEPRVISSDGSASGRIVQDTGGDGSTGADDAAARTMVELVLRDVFTISLFTDAKGEFHFGNIPAGQYELWIWWGAGFINAPAATTATITSNPGVFITTVTVASDNTVRAVLPPVLLVEVPTSGAAFQYPIRTGGASPQYTGTVDVAAAIRQTGVPALPSAGGGSDEPSTVRWLLPLALFIAAVPASLWALNRSRRRS